MNIKKFWSSIWSFSFLMIASFAVWGVEEKLQDLAQWTGIPGQLQVYILSFLPTPDPVQARSLFREWLHGPKDQQIIKHCMNSAADGLQKLSAGFQNHCAFALHLLKENAVGFSGLFSLVKWKQANKKPPSLEYFS